MHLFIAAPTNNLQCNFPIIVDRLKHSPIRHRIYKYVPIHTEMFSIALPSPSSSVSSQLLLATWPLVELCISQTIICMLPCPSTSWGALLRFTSSTSRLSKLQRYGSSRHILPKHPFSPSHLHTSSHFNPYTPRMAPQALPENRNTSMPPSTPPSTVSSPATFPYPSKSNPSNPPPSPRTQPLSPDP